jgi:ATP-dependent DNA helicase RecG
MGTRQAGMPDLRLANLVRDVDILEQAREAAFELVKRDPTLSRPEHEPLRRYLEEQLREKVELVQVS